MNRLPSASRVQRVLACAASHALPQSPLPASPAAEAGTARHEALCWRILGPASMPPAVDDDTMEWLDSLEDGDLEPLLDQEAEVLSEVAYAYDVLWDSARVIGRHVGREYGATSPTEVVGSADYVVRKDGHLMVVDLKTGRAELPAPEEHPQLLTLALCAHMVEPATSIEVATLHAPDGSLPRWLRAHVTVEQLRAHGERLAAMYRQVEDARAVVQAGQAPEVVPGAHCRYCPARPSCPRQAELAQAATAPAQVSAFRAQWQAALAARDGAPVLAAMLALRAEADAIEEALEAAAREAPVPVGDGRVMAWRTVEREAIDAQVAWTVLGNRYGVEVARAAMTLETSKAGLQRALRDEVARMKAAGMKTSLKSEVELALEALRTAGAVTTKSTERCEERKQ